jgi:hypothetical protein
LSTRFVVVHYHILKNGGSTIESVLKREFGQRFSPFDDTCADSVLGETELTNFLEARPEVSAISSHHLRYPKPAIRNTVIFDCCFLRHPMDRLQSLYTWARRTDSSDPLSRIARSAGSREFIYRLLHEFPHMVSNVQVTLLASGGAFTRPANENDLDVATSILREMAIPGLVELFDESLMAAEYFLRPAFPAIQLHYQPQNVTRPEEPHRVGREKELENKLAALWGESTWADLCRLNEFDLELYQRARREVERRFFLVPGLTEKTVDFEARCGRNHTPEPVLEFRMATPETSTARR